KTCKSTFFFYSQKHYGRLQRLSLSAQRFSLRKKTLISLNIPHKNLRAEKIPPRVTSGLAHIDSVDQLSLSQALIRLEKQPIGASLLIFMPDYAQTSKGVYRGRMTNRSYFRSVQEVSVMSVIEKNGEKLLKVRLNDADMAGDDEGYLKVSMEGWRRSNGDEVEKRNGGHEVEESFLRNK
ncbi:hypothetical protein HID58_040824, partial [Brassica napus]